MGYFIPDITRVAQSHPVYIRIGGGVRYSIEAIIAYEREYMFGTDQQENLDSYIPPMDYSKENE
jgi:hypothetical protein